MRWTHEIKENSAKANFNDLIDGLFFLLGTYTDLLRELVAEFTLTDNPANTTTSLLRTMCHVDDSVILGSWLQETDHKAIEDQVPIGQSFSHVI